MNFEPDFLTEALAEAQQQALNSLQIIEAAVLTADPTRERIEYLRDLNEILAEVAKLPTVWLRKI